MHKIIDLFKSYGVDTNTAGTAVLTILIFVVGLFFAWLGKSFAAWKKKLSYRKSLIYILTDFEKSCNKQFKTVSASLKNAGLKDGKDFIINYVPIGTLDYLNKMDFTVFLENFEPLFFKKNYSKAISKLFGLIVQIKDQNDNIRESMKFMMDSYTGHEKTYNESIDILRRLHDQLGLQYHGKPVDGSQEGEFAQKLFNIFGYFVSENPKLDIASTHEHVILPILELNKQYMTSISHEISTYALACDVSYINVEKIDMFLFDKFKNFAHFHRRAGKLVQVIIKILS